MRYEAAGAVYHLMARGDGGKPVFEDDKDRYGWLDLMERACGGFGWRVHAWVLMGNHFHLLSEDHLGGRAYAGYLEARAKDAKGAVTDAALKELLVGTDPIGRLPRARSSVSRDQRFNFLVIIANASLASETCITFAATK